MIGERIKQARKAAGLSLRALADRAGVTAMAISKYEGGKSTPSSRVLLDLSKALGVRTEYFFRPVKIELQEMKHRKHSRLPKKALDQIEGDVKEQLERFMELEQLLPNGPVQAFKLPEHLPAPIATLDEVEAVARDLRTSWGLGIDPIPVLTGMLEERGIKVFQSQAINNRFDGMAATVDGIPVVVVGRGWPGDRQRFTLAHELGHLVLQGRLAPDVEEEAAANRFAGAFLAPADEVRKELGEKRVWLEPRELEVLKKTYGLSMQGWMHRAKDLGILPDTHYVEMRKFFSSRGWNKTEPGEQYPPERPQLFDQLVYRALGQDLISESKAAELLRMPLTEFQKKRNMPSGRAAAH
jgi:Zn-dependent peptidase ImmA (M78 family)/transcriptional regulator with XRE-family HTH domain